MSANEVNKNHQSDLDRKLHWLSNDHICKMILKDNATSMSLLPHTLI